MRNLKRALSLVLALVMVVGLMVVGAGAASYNDLTDKDEIVNEDAVSMLVSLGVIEGKPDGSYAPQENVDRAQMAKMLSVIMNRGVDNSSLYQNVNSGLTDIDANWAKGHINYCYTTGIIAGRGNGTFDPGATVTALEAAKMLLVAIGYDPDIEGFVGTDWALNVSVRADQLGIFNNFTKDITAPLNRDDAALLIYNAMDVEMVQSYTTNNYPIVYSDHRTLLSDRYGVIRVQGVVVANEWATVNTNDGDSALLEGKTTIYNAEGIFSTTTNTTVSSAEENIRTQTFNVSTPVDMLGKTVDLYIRKATILADSVVYGDPVISDINTVATTGEKVVYGDPDKNSDEVNYEDFLSDNGLSDNNRNNTEYFWNYNRGSYIPNTTEDYGVKTANVKGATLTVIDNDGDGEVDYVLSVEKALTDITAYNTNRETVTLRQVGTIDFEDVVGYENMARDDVVLCVQYGGRTYVEVPEMVTGEMTYFNVRGSEKYMVVNDTRYHADGLDELADSDVSKFYVEGCDSETQPDGTPGTGLVGVQFDATYNFYLDDYDNVIAFEEVEGVSNYALVLDSAFSTNMLNTDAQVKVLLPTGETATYTLNWSASAANFDDYDLDGVPGADDNGAEYLKYFLGTDDGRAGNIGVYPAAGAAAGNLIAYTLNDNNQMTISMPKLSVGGPVNGDAAGHYTSHDAPGWPSANPAHFFENADDVLTADLLNDDVEVATNDGDYGIDADTIVYYYDGKDGAVAVGYEAMARKIAHQNVGGALDDKIDEAGVKVSIVSFYKDDVANVMVVYTSQADFGNDEYVLVMPEFNVYNGDYRYTVVHEDGSMEAVRSDDDLRTPLTGAYRDYGIVCTITENSDGTVNLKHVDTYGDATHVVLGAVKVTSNRYVNVYSNYVGAIQNSGTDDEWLDLRSVSGAYRVASDADLVYDIENTDVDDTQANSTTFQDGQIAYVVYDESDRTRDLIAAFVVDSYLTEDPSGPSGGGGPVELDYVVIEDTGHITVQLKGGTTPTGDVDVKIYSSGYSSSNDFALVRTVRVTLDSNGYANNHALGFSLIRGAYYQFEVYDGRDLLGTSGTILCN